MSAYATTAMTHLTQNDARIRAASRHNFSTESELASTSDALTHNSPLPLYTRARDIAYMETCVSASPASLTAPASHSLPSCAVYRRSPRAIGAPP